MCIAMLLIAAGRDREILCSNRCGVNAVQRAAVSVFIHVCMYAYM